jgi:uncharacterized membrane-anchored protein
MLSSMTPARYGLAVIAVFCLGTAAGAFVNHRAGSSYTVAIVLAVVGVAAALAAWQFDRLFGGSPK